MRFMQKRKYLAGRLLAWMLRQKERHPASGVLAQDGRDGERGPLWFDRIVDDESPWKGSHFVATADGALYLATPPR
jgi:hypothetical protein